MFKNYLNVCKTSFYTNTRLREKKEKISKKNKKNKKKKKLQAQPRSNGNYTTLHGIMSEYTFFVNAQIFTMKNHKLYHTKSE